jgi:Domain of unknown function (DUF4440)
MDDTKVLTELNTQFIDAFRQGSWELLEPILSPSFRYLDGATGEAWAQERYVEYLRGSPAPALALDQVVVHVDGNTAVVSARTSRHPGGIQPVRGHVRAKRRRLGLHPRLRLAVDGSPLGLDGTLPLRLRMLGAETTNEPGPEPTLARFASPAVESAVIHWLLAALATAGSRNRRIAPPAQRGGRACSCPV